MKIGFVGRLVARYFGPRATSVSPKIEFGSYSVAIGTRWTNAFDETVRITPIPPGPYVDPRQRGAEPEPIGSTLVRAVDERPGIKPPSDPAIEGWTWAAWKRELDAGALPGWAVCRFANRIGPDHAAFVFGVVRGSFGIWRQPFSVCASGADRTDHILTCLTHLRSGFGIGIFSSREVAAEAAEIADRVCPGWETLDPDDRAAWNEVHSRTGVAWAGIGVHCLEDAHCHDQSGNIFGIYSRTAESMMAGRPQTLS